MKRQTAKIQSLKGKIVTLINLVKLGIKKYILQLVELEGCLESAQHSQLFTEAQIKAAFEKVAGDFRYWKSEMIALIPAIVGAGLRPCDPWQHWVKNAVIQQMEVLGWRDRHIELAISTANLLG